MPVKEGLVGKALPDLSHLLANWTHFIYLGDTLVIDLSLILT